MIKLKTLALLSPTEQVKLCGLDIPPFLRRPKPPKGWRPTPYIVPVRTFHPIDQRPSNLTERDKEVINEILGGATSLAEFDKAKSRQSLDNFLALRPKRVPSQKRAMRTNLVDMKVIAASLGIEPRQARQALRDLGLTKGDAGWVFHPTEVEMITQKIRSLIPAKEK